MHHHHTNQQSYKISAPAESFIHQLPGHQAFTQAPHSLPATGPGVALEPSRRHSWNSKHGRFLSCRVPVTPGGHLWSLGTLSHLPSYVNGKKCIGHSLDAINFHSSCCPTITLHSSCCPSITLCWLSRLSSSLTCTLAGMCDPWQDGTHHRHTSSQG